MDSYSAREIRQHGTRIEYTAGMDQPERQQGQKQVAVFATGQNLIAVNVSEPGDFEYFAHPRRDYRLFELYSVPDEKLRPLAESEEPDYSTHMLEQQKRPTSPIR